MPNLADTNQAPPPGPAEPNLQNVMFVHLALSSWLPQIAIALRLLTRKFVVKSFGWDDWTIIAAGLGEVIGFSLVLVEMHYGFGRHKVDLSKEQYIQFTRFGYAEWIQNFQTLMFTKVSIALFLLRIVINRAFIYSLRSLIGILVTSNIILTIIWIAQCHPVELAWLSPNQPGACLGQEQLRQIILVQAIFSLTSDFILAAYPIFILRKLQMHRQVKVGLCILMGLGVITGSFSTVRAVGNWQNVNEDNTWWTVYNWYWRTWEVCVGIIVACLPAMHPGYRALRERWRKRAQSDRKKTSNHSSDKSVQPSLYSKASTPSRTAQRLQPLPTIPILPAGTFRPDLRAARVAAGAEASYDDFVLPIQGATGIIKTTRVDLESQRATSNESDVPLSRRTGAWDSETTLSAPKDLI